MKIFIDGDEWYPVYTAVSETVYEDEEESWNGPFEELNLREVPESTYEWWNYAHKLFKAQQKEMRKFLKEPK